MRYIGLKAQTRVEAREGPNSDKAAQLAKRSRRIPRGQGGVHRTGERNFPHFFACADDGRISVRLEPGRIATDFVCRFLRRY